MQPFLVCWCDNGFLRLIVKYIVFKNFIGKESRRSVHLVTPTQPAFFKDNFNLNNKKKVFIKISYTSNECQLEFFKLKKQSESSGIPAWALKLVARKYTQVLHFFSMDI